MHFVCVPFQFRLVVKGFVANFTNTCFASFHVLFTVFVSGEGLSACSPLYMTVLSASSPVRIKKVMSYLNINIIPDTKILIMVHMHY